MNYDKAAQEARGECDALLLFKNDIGAFRGNYSFLSQIFDYGNTAVEKRFLFYRRLAPLLEFGGEREGVDLSKVTLTHYGLKTQGSTRLTPVTATRRSLRQLPRPARGRSTKRRSAARGDYRACERLVRRRGHRQRPTFVPESLKGKLMESEELKTQAENNTPAQFANSPTLSQAMLNGVMDALAAHTTMSRQALESEKVREGLRDVLLGPARLYEALRERAGQLAGGEARKTRGALFGSHPWLQEDMGLARES